jgi:hypothetical protein
VAWYERLQRARAFYGASDRVDCARLGEMAGAYAVTRLVVSASREVSCRSTHALYSDDAFAVYEIRDGRR